MHTAAGKPISTLAIGRPRFALWTSPQADIAAEHVVAVRVAPNEVEIHCHGGNAVCQWLLDDLQRAGCTPCNDSSHPGIGATSLSLEEEAHACLVHASTLKTSAALLDQLQGALRRELNQIVSLIESRQLSDACSLVAALLERYQLGRWLVEPPRLAMAGPPNAGKSSLTNALVGSNRVLVHHLPGTTRDAVDATLVIGQWPLVLTDTAGVRDALEPIERQGILTAESRWQSCDFGLLIIDVQEGWTETHAQLLLKREGPIVIVLNKCDLVNHADRHCLKELTSSIEDRIRGSMSEDQITGIVRCSATMAGGVEELMTLLAGRLDSALPPAGSGIPFLRRHFEQLSLADSALRNCDQRSKPCRVRL